MLLLVAVLVSPVQSRYPNALRAKQTSDALPEDSPASIPLLVLIFTQASNTARRQWQRQTWLKQRWTRGELLPSTGTRTAQQPSINWRYVYVQARTSNKADKADDGGPLDTVHGDTVTLSTVTESYENLVYKTLEALRWALRHVAFGSLLKTDDDSIVHVGRVSAWLQLHVRPQSRATLYAGRVFNDSQIIRFNFTKANLLHPEWFPDDFVKWAVPYESYSGAGLYYPPYCSGGGYLLGPPAARKVVQAYDVRAAAARPVVRVEDAFVGILASEQLLSPTDISEYVQDPPAGREQTPELFGGRMLVHRVTDPKKAFEWLIFPSHTSLELAGVRRARRRSHAAASARHSQTYPAQ